MRAPGVEALGEPVPAESMSEEARGNPLAEYFLGNQGRLVHKWHHYFEIYHRHLAQFRQRAPVVLEIGVSQGGSLQMWRKYFGEGTQVIGIDVEPRCRQFQDDATTILIGDQADLALLADVRARFPRIDIIIDDGSHRVTDQITTFGELYPHLQPRGVYVCEDVHTSYMPRYGGGLRRPGTFIEFSKLLIDALHAWYYTGEGDELDAYTTGILGINVYDSIVVVEKRPIARPRHSKTGKASF